MKTVKRTVAASGHWRWMLLLLVLVSGRGFAASLFAVVSDRSAAELAAGAALFEQRHPGHALVMRTTSQIDELSDTELAGYWRAADAVLLAAAFGDSVVPRLQRLAAAAPLAVDTPLLVVNSDRQLLSLSQLDGRRPMARLDKATMDALTGNPGAGDDPAVHYKDLRERFPQQAAWLAGHAYWNSRGSENSAGLIAWLLARTGAAVEVPAPAYRDALRYYRHGRVVQAGELGLAADTPAVALLDTDAGDQLGNRDLLDSLCQRLEAAGTQCFAVLARWGDASLTAVQSLPDISAPAKLGAIVSLQGFVVGGGDGWEAVAAALEGLDVPVLSAIRLATRTEAEWRLSGDGVPAAEVHYRVGMPEFQGVSQPLVVAAAEAPGIDPLTGLRLAVTRPLEDEVGRLVRRVDNWLALQRKANADKRVAIVYYNHPPGRHNIGADNLDVPSSLWHILKRLQAAGYDTGELPATPEALLEQIQQRGINLPENGEALRRMAPLVASVDAADYRQWFDGLPETVRAGVSDGPVALLLARVREALDLERPARALEIVHTTVHDLEHVLEAIRHPARERALNLLAQLETALDAVADREVDWSEARTLARALEATGVPGLRGWGEPPGWVMTHGDSLLVPGLRFGKVFIGPQPPRGWEVDEELLHANLSFPPPHQYLAFYRYLQADFGADALIHLGRHSTYEFLPGRALGLTATDYPALIAGDVPGIYPYIVDGVGEGLQAKRRGLAVIVDHLTPPLRTTPLYDELLQLRQLVESFEASATGGSPARRQAVGEIRRKLAALDLESEIAGEIAAEHGVDAVVLDQVDNELLVHEVGHYLTEMQEAFMPHGLHVFGRDWQADALDMMVDSMAGDSAAAPERADWRAALAASPDREMDALLAALDGRFVAPGKGNDPVRSPEVLPTGRNFHGLNGSLLPTRVGYALGAQLAAEARRQGPEATGSEAVVLWASDTARDEGAVVAFGMDMLGVRPVWNSRGIVEGLERVPLSDERERRDTVFTTSGLFRDLYGELLVWLDKSVRLALQGSAATIVRDYPALVPALDAALAPVAALGEPGDEPLARNRVARHWVEDARAALEGNAAPAEAGVRAVYRVFGDPPGSYGAGINRLAERSGSWRERGELAATYLNRMGHAYGVGTQGMSAQADFRGRLASVERTYLGRASNLYGLLDNNDAFDYLGGLSLAVEQVTGSAPDNRVINHADPGNARIDRLETALLAELRGRFLNPAWIEPLMSHGYAGARTMGSEFLEYLWGWQVTNPEIVRSWAWDEVNAVYFQDKYGLGLDEFLGEGSNAHVKANMLAVLLVAAHKGYWEADQEALAAVAGEFATLVAVNGLPGSGHTGPDHPMLAWVEPLLSEAQAAGLQQAIAAARGAPRRPQNATASTIAELQTQDTAAGGEAVAKPAGEAPGEARESGELADRSTWLLLAAAGLVGGGMLAGARRRRAQA